MRSPRNHSLCERCWFDGPLGQLDDGRFRVPVRVNNADVTACCQCGRVTVVGIFTRWERGTFLCHGEHDELTWSHVRIESQPTPSPEGDAGLP